MMRLIPCLIFLFIIYEAFQILCHIKKTEGFFNYNLNMKMVKNDNDKRKKEKVYKNLGIPNEWYNFENKGYSYLDPKHWKVPQPRQPICYDKDNTTPSPIMTPGTHDAMFYIPGK